MKLQSQAITVAAALPKPLPKVATAQAFKRSSLGYTILPDWVANALTMDEPENAS
jgi:hypothetical protein